MHILFITEFFTDLNKPVFAGGVEVRVFYIAKYIAKFHQVTVIARRRNGEKRLEKKGKLQIIRQKNITLSQDASLLSLIPRLNFLCWSIYKGLKIKADIIEGSNYVVFMPAYLIGMIKGIPRVSYYPDVLVGNWQKQFGFLLGLFGELGERIFSILHWNKFLTISNAAALRLNKLGIDNKEIKVIPCGVDLGFFSQQNLLKLKKENKLIVISRLVRYKRVDWSIKVFGKIHLNFPDYKLLIIGEGPEENKLISLIKKLKLNKKVIFVKKLDLISLYYQLATAKLLLHPSLIEGFGIVLTEAAALGTPFIAADIPTSVYLSKNLQSGLIFKQNNLNDFYIKTKMLLNNSLNWRQFSQNGKEKVKQFDWKNIGRDTLNLYKQIYDKSKH